MAVLDVHAPEAEAIHNLTEGVILVVKLDGASNIEDDFGFLAHVEGVDSAGHLSDVVTRLAFP